MLKLFSDIGGTAGLLIGFSLFGFWSFIQENCIKRCRDKVKSLIDRKKNRVIEEGPVFRLRRRRTLSGSVPPPDDQLSLIKELINGVINENKELRHELRNHVNEANKKLNETNKLNFQLVSRINALEHRI